MPVNAELAEQMSDLFDRWTLFIDEWRTQVIGASDGGPSGNGYFPLTDPTGFPHLVPSPARIALEAKQLQIGELFGAGPHAVGANQAGKLVRMSHTAQIAVTLQRNAPVGTVVGFVQVAAGRVRLGVQSGALSLRHRQGFNATAGQWAEMWAKVVSNSNGTNAEWQVTGDMIFL